MLWDFGKITRKGGPEVKKLIREKFCPIVIIVVQYLDKVITIIFPKFQTLVTSITGKVIDVSSKKTCFEIIDVINKWWTRDTNVTIGVHDKSSVSLQKGNLSAISRKKQL